MKNPHRILRYAALGLALGLAPAWAQTTPAAPAPDFSISGVVRDIDSGAPLPKFEVSTQARRQDATGRIRSERVADTTDAGGQFHLHNLPAGSYRLSARSPEQFLGAYIEVNLSTESLEGLEFRIAVPGRISGKVVDENKEPVPNVRVTLIAREYFLGSLGYFRITGAMTDDLGQYSLTSVSSGRGYLLVVESQPVFGQAAMAETPLNPKLRRRVAAQGFYPNSPVIEGALPLSLASGEWRDGIDLQTVKAPSYCISGVVEGVGGTAPYQYNLAPASPVSGVFNGGGSYTAETGGPTKADGKFRVCGLYPGNWRFSAHDKLEMGKGPGGFRVANLVIGDRDLDNVKISLATPQPVAGDVAWDGAAALDPLPNGLSVYIQAMRRTQFGEESRQVKADIPGAFVLPVSYPDLYQIHTTVTGPGLYVKDIAAGGRSILDQPFDASAPSDLHVTIGADGATVAATVTGKNSQPLGDVRVFLIPADVAQEAAIAARIAAGKTNQLGVWTSPVLPPGKYFALATHDKWDYTPEKLAKLLALRDRAKEVLLTARGSATVKLELADAR